MLMASLVTVQQQQLQRSKAKSLTFRLLVDGVSCKASSRLADLKTLECSTQLFRPGFQVSQMNARARRVGCNKMPEQAI